MKYGCAGKGKPLFFGRYSDILLKDARQLKDEARILYKLNSFLYFQIYYLDALGIPVINAIFLSFFQHDVN